MFISLFACSRAQMRQSLRQVRDQHLQEMEPVMKRASQDRDQKDYASSHEASCTILFFYSYFSPPFLLPIYYRNMLHFFAMCELTLS